MTIPVSSIVSVNPGVIGAGGSPLALNGVILSKSLFIPTGTVQSFADSDAVSDYFGPASTEYALSQVYFAGYDNSTIKPGTLFFAPFVDVVRAGWLQSGSLAGMSLTDLQALGSGTVIVTVDGVSKTSSSIALGAIASFSAAATAIAAAFTGTPLTCTWDAVRSVFVLTSATTGASSTMSFATGTLSTGLKLTSATGAVLSAGSAVDTPSGAMDNVKAATQNWVAFATMWEPLLADKQLFAAWATLQGSRYMYVAWDTDTQATTSGSTTAFGVVARRSEYDGVMCVYNTASLAVFVLGLVGSIDFSRANGRTAGAFRSQSGFTPTATDKTTADILLANGYSFYGSYAEASSQFNFLYDGNLPGKWKWLDTFVDQVYLNSQFRASLIALLTSIGAVPYNEQGYSLIRAAMIDSISAALNFGTIRAGVTLSESQKAQVNAAAGRSVGQTIEQQGYYLQILDPGSTVRAARGTPVINFWYTDGGSIQQINIASIDIL